MIAPLRAAKSDPHPADQRQLAVVRRILAATLLLRSDMTASLPSIPPCRAWLVAAWLVCVAVVYGWTMLETRFGVLESWRRLSTLHAEYRSSNAADPSFGSPHR